MTARRGMRSPAHEGCNRRLGSTPLQPRPLGLPRSVHALPTSASPWEARHTEHQFVSATLVISPCRVRVRPQTLFFLATAWDALGSVAEARGGESGSYGGALSQHDRGTRPKSPACLRRSGVTIHDPRPMGHDCATALVASRFVCRFPSRRTTDPRRNSPFTSPISWIQPTAAQTQGYGISTVATTTLRAPTFR